MVSLELWLNQTKSTIFIHRGTMYHEKPGEKVNERRKRNASPIEKDEETPQEIPCTREICRPHYTTQ
jgi:hypothetical protein